MFNTRTIVTLEKLLGGSTDHPTHRQAILHVFSNGFGLPSMIRTIALAFLGCWVLNILRVVICFQQDNHPILLDVIAHVEISHFLVSNGSMRCPSHVTLGCPLSGPTL